MMLMDPARHPPSFQNPASFPITITGEVLESVVSLDLSIHLYNTAMDKILVATTEMPAQKVSFSGYSFSPLFGSQILSWL